MYTYLLINFFSVFVPFIASFDKRLNHYKNFNAVAKAIFTTGAPFIIWDIYFTHLGVWGFNAKYLSGIYFFGLPLGEYLFFICIPFACTFTYVSLGFLIKKDYFKPAVKTISACLIIGLVVVASFNLNKAYTASTFILTSLFVGYLQYIAKANWLSRFYFTFLIILFPFLIVNGILTGSGIDQEVVWYNNAENLGIRIGTIPIEDTFYGLLLLIMNVFFYEKWKK